MNRRRIFNISILLSATAAILLDYNGNALFYICKPLTTFLVILLAVFAKESKKKFRKTIVLALCFCLLGDIFLMKVDYFVFGLAAFLIGHLVFSRAFIQINGVQKNWKTAFVLLLIGIGLYSWLYESLEGLKLPVAAYILVILLMAWQAFGLYFSLRLYGYGLLAIGAVLFLISDSVIAINKFKTPFELAGPVILTTYWLAISLIANATYFVVDENE